MFRPTRTLLALLCLIALAATAGPALSQPPGPIVINPALLLKTVTVIGAGETLASAQANALAEIRTTYLVLSYTTANPLCSDLPLTNQEPSVTLCSIEVTARVIHKAF